MKVWKILVLKGNDVVDIHWIPMSKVISCIIKLLVKFLAQRSRAGGLFVELDPKLSVFQSLFLPSRF